MASELALFKKWLSVILIFLEIFGISCDDVHPHDVDVNRVMRSYNKYSMMQLFTAGDFWMGIDDPYSETGEYPYRIGHTKSYYIDIYPTSNAQYWEFAMKKRKYRTEAETRGYSWVLETEVSKKTRQNMAVQGIDNWLAVKRANWEHPEGPDSMITKRWLHPAVHVSHKDAATYCKWRGKRLPTEAEWERAARGNRTQKVVQYPWGDDWLPKRSNVWQGIFPKKNLYKDGFYGTSPVDAFAAQNEKGMYDMIGNVWEWTDTPYYQPFVPVNEQEVQMILKGGSYIDDRRGHFNYMVRTSQRMAQPKDYTASNVGFRCVKDAPRHDPDYTAIRRERERQWNIKQKLKGKAKRRDEL